MSASGRLATEIRRRLGPAPEPRDAPLVSIVVLNRDGAGHLRRLLAGLVERTDYPALELIVVDNGSSDESVELLRSAEAPFPVSVIANAHNESFSDANNQGAEAASGELLLFLNNDIEPFEPGWLAELVACHRSTGAGAVAATLICPDEEHEQGYRVQSERVWLRADTDNLTVRPDIEERRLFDASFGEDAPSAFLIGACLLVESRLFAEIGGFTHGYFYGAEDQDLSLKLHERGRATVYSGRSLLIHHASSTSRDLLGEHGGPLRAANIRLFRSIWSARLWREHQLNRLAGGGLWAAPDRQARGEAPSLEEALRLGFCLKADGLPAEPEELAALAAELERRGHRCLVLRDAPIAEPRGLFFDVAVHLRGPVRYVPQPGQMNVLWLLGDRDVSAIERGRYDLAVAAGDGPPGRLSAELIDVVLTRAAELGLPARIEPGPIPPAALATEIRRRLGPAPEPRDAPLVSIVVLNRDGAGHLRRLLAGLVERTDYPALELIVVDNGSSDESVELLRSAEAPFPVSVIANAHNESFSDANNQGAEAASGELLLFLNNDIEPFEPDWLAELVACRRDTGAGAVAATLICPGEEHERGFAHGYGVQHRGLTFAQNGERAEPGLRGWEDDPLDEALGEDLTCEAVAAACLLIAADAYAAAGGFSPGYFYGCEDADLSLKLRAEGMRTVCSGRSIAIHRPVSTRRRVPFEQARKTKLANRRLLWERWGAQLRPDYERGV